MARSSLSASPPPAMQCRLEFPFFGQLRLAETWSMRSHDFDIDRILDAHEAHLAELMQGQQAGPYLVRKLPKKRCRPTREYLNTLPVHTPHTQSVTLKPEPEPTYGRANPEYGDHDELDSLLLEAARLASLEQLAMERGTLDGVNSHAETPTTGNGPHLEAYRMVYSRSPTPPVDYNAHGCITARSKGKGRAD